MTKPTKWHVPSEDSDQPGHPSSLRCPHEESLGPELPIERIAKTLIRLGECLFCHEVAQLCFVNKIQVL